MVSNSEFKDQLDRLQAIERKYLDKDIAANWMEQDADEKGLELFIRAGYDPTAYGGLFEKLGQSREFGGEVPKALIKELSESKSSSDDHSERSALACHIADRVNPDKCDRGDGSHPTPCWRQQNISDELAKHANDYRDLLAKATATNALGTKLQDLQNYYYRANMSEAIAFLAKTSDPTPKSEGCVDRQPDNDTCAEKKAWGQCDAEWLRSKNWCRCTCGY